MRSPWFTEEHELFRQSVQQFVQQYVLPNGMQWEEDERVPGDVWKKMGELGFLGINMPEAYGGSNNDFFFSVVLLEEIAKSGYAGFAAGHSVHQYMATAHLIKAGSEALKQQYLPGAISGELIGSLAVSEPGAGSDVASIRTTAKREGDHYIINGQKTFITNGVYGDFVTLACKTDPDAGIGGISLIMVDQRTPGFTTNKLKKIGWHSSDTGELFFDDVKVPVTNLVGEEGKGFYYIMDSFQLERLVAGISGIAGCKAVLDITLKYIQEREAFGRPIAKFQVLRHKLVELMAEVEAVQQLVYTSSWHYNQGNFAVKECSMVKMLATELGKKVVDECLQCFGGYGYMEEYPIARMYRDARVGTIVGGTTEIMKEILAKILIDGMNYDPAYTAGNDQRSSDNQSSNSNKNQQSMGNTPETAKEIILSLPERFRPEKAEGESVLFHFKIDGPNGGEFTVKVEDGKCEVSEGLQGDASCVVTTNDKVYEDVELGRTNPQMAVMMGKIKISNLGEMMKFINWFQRIS